MDHYPTHNPPDIISTITDSANKERLKRLETEGVSLDELVPGESYDYHENGHDFKVTILGKSVPVTGFIRDDTSPRPVISIERSFRGELLDSATGILLGVSPFGTPIGIEQRIPRAGSELMAFVIETLPSGDEDNSDPAVYTVKAP